MQGVEQVLSELEKRNSILNFEYTILKTKLANIHDITEKVKIKQRLKDLRCMIDHVVQTSDEMESILISQIEGRKRTSIS